MMVIIKIIRYIFCDADLQCRVEWCVYDCFFISGVSNIEAAAFPFFPFRFCFDTKTRFHQLFTQISYFFFFNHMPTSLIFLTEALFFAVHIFLRE